MEYIYIDRLDIEFTAC